jgi:hypothetical protein
MKRLLLTPLAIVVSFACHRPASKTPETNIDDIINKDGVEQIERVLSHDSMLGRKVNTPGIEKAADFIASEFQKIGLEPLNNATSYRQEFQMWKPTLISTTATINGQTTDAANVFTVSSVEDLTVTDQSGFSVMQVKAGEDLVDKAITIMQHKENVIVFIDKSFERLFKRLGFFKSYVFPKQNSQVFVLSSEMPASYSINVKHSFKAYTMANIVGVLPGKKKLKDEQVIFSAHYDHLGFGRPSAEGDSLYNGANDDASGVTAVITLAKYYKAQNNNERTLIFAAFTAEEIGGFGSVHFSEQMNADKVKAMFNIEMIGTESKWGKNSAYITGFDKTDMGTILQNDLIGSGSAFYPDPYPEQKLFLRSDNATLARLGVPAHTISTSKMDVEKYYHKPDDEIETLDMENMAAIIRSIALSSKGIVSGKETPGRVKNE